MIRLEGQDKEFIQKDLQERRLPETPVFKFILSITDQRIFR